MFATLVGVGVAAGRRVDAHDARRQQGLRVVGSPLHGRRAGLPVRERHGEGGRIAVALQVHPVAADPQRVIDLQPVGRQLLAIRSAVAGSA